MMEYEKTYLAKGLPEDLDDHESYVMVDVYFPKDSKHPVLRLRRKGNSYELTKKEPVGDDKSHQEEHTIPLTKEEFDALAQVDGKRLEKRRYLYDDMEIDVFEGDLKGLVLVDKEFGSMEELNDFTMPDFCLADVSQEEFIAGGMLCGKRYEDIAGDLERFGYTPIG